MKPHHFFFSKESFSGAAAAAWKKSNKVNEGPISDFADTAKGSRRIYFVYLCMLNSSGSGNCANELFSDVKALTCLDDSSRRDQQHANGCWLNSWGWAATQSSKLERCGSEQQSFWVLGQNSESMSSFYHVLVMNSSTRLCILSALFLWCGPSRSKVLDHTSKKRLVIEIASSLPSACTPNSRHQVHQNTFAKWHIV